MICPVVQAIQVQYPRLCFSAQAPFICLLAELGQFVHTYRRVEELHLHDLATVSAYKTLQEVAGTADHYTVQIAKSLQDNPVVIERLTQELSKRLQDLAGTSDAQFTYLGKQLKESAFGVVDLVQPEVIKSTQDVVTWSDSHYERITKGLLDSPRLIEVVAVSSTRFAQDQNIVLDRAAVNYQRNVFDTVGATDDLDGTASLLDEQVATFTKGINRGVRFTEHIERLVISNRSFADEYRISDSGLIRMQNYAEFSYFAEDFVGVFTSF